MANAFQTISQIAKTWDPTKVDEPDAIITPPPNSPNLGQKDFRDSGRITGGLKKGLVDECPIRAPNDDDPELDLEALYLWPLEEFVPVVAKESIKRGWPKEWGEDKYYSQTWYFVRVCKGHVELTYLSADEAADMIPWELTDFTDDDQWRFVEEWNRVQFIPGKSPLDWALGMAMEKPLKPRRRRNELYERFISLCGWQQVLVGEKKDIILPVRLVSDLLDCSKNTVTAMRKAAMRDGLLRQTVSHTSNRATRFRFAVERFEILQVRQ